MTTDKQRTKRIKQKNIQQCGGQVAPNSIWLGPSNKAKYFFSLYFFSFTEEQESLFFVVNLLLTSCKAPVFVFLFFYVEPQVLTQRSHGFYWPNFPFHRTPWKGDLSLSWRSSKLSFWVSFLFGGKAPSLPRPMACLLLIRVKTFAPSRLLLPLLLGLEDSPIACPTSDSHSSPCIIILPWPVAVTPSTKGRQLYLLYLTLIKINIILIVYLKIDIYNILKNNYAEFYNAWGSFHFKNEFKCTKEPSICW